MKKKFIMPIITGIVALGIGGQAVSAASVSKAGGTWNYGVGVTGSFSDYYHASRAHTATTKKGTKIDKAGNPAGKWAKSRLLVYSGCNFYYGFQ